MTVRVAKNSSVLRKRLLRFFAKYSQEPGGLDDFLNDLGQYGDILLFGGAIRDMALNGIRDFNSDLDFVFVGDSQVLSKQLQAYTVQANKFGGYRLIYCGLSIDIWPIRETWAFKQSLVDYQSIASLLNTTITNWDAILFSWLEKKLIYPPHYFEHINQGYLDIVLANNPNQIGLLVRILRHFVLKEAHIFSPQLSHLVYDKLQVHTLDDLTRYEKNSYSEYYITANLTDYLSEKLSQVKNHQSSIVLDKFNQTLPLFKSE